MEKKSYTGNMMGEKILYPEVWEKKIVTQTKSPIPLPPQWSNSNGQPLNNMSKRFVF